MVTWKRVGLRLFCDATEIRKIVIVKPLIGHEALPGFPQLRAKALIRTRFFSFTMWTDLEGWNRLVERILQQEQYLLRVRNYLFSLNHCSFPDQLTHCFSAKSFAHVCTPPIWTTVISVCFERRDICTELHILISALITWPFRFAALSTIILVGKFTIICLSNYPSQVKWSTINRTK